MNIEFKLRPTRCAVRISGAALIAVVVSAAFTGCVHYRARPLAASTVADDFASRSFNDPGLRRFMESNHSQDEWPRRSWDLESLVLAAFYFSPELDLARARWATAQAGSRTAGQRPNPTVSVAPRYNTTTLTPSPWVVGLNFDLPLETAGKRGYRLALAEHLSDAAKLNIATTAWLVRGSVRRALVDFHTAGDQERLLAAQLAAQGENVKLLEAQLGAGAISPAEVTRERIAFDTTRLGTLDARRQREESRVALAEAIGVPVGALEGVEITPAGLERIPEGFDSAAARRAALLGRADILSALAEYAASEASLRLEIARQYPDIHLNPGYEFDQGDNKWGVGLGMELPVLNQNRGPIAEAEARRGATATKFNALQAHVLAEVDRALAAYRGAVEKSAAADSLLGSLEEQEQRLRARFQAGDVSRSEEIAGQVEFAAARLAQADAIGKARQALGQVEVALQRPLSVQASVLEFPPRADAKEQASSLLRSEHSK